MLSFKSYIVEAHGSGYSDEHALANAWNHAVSHPNASHLLSNSSHLHDEIEKAKSDTNHPLNFANQKDGFTGGKKPEHEDAYYSELHHAADAVHGIANHPSFKNAVKNKLQAKVSGASKGKLSDNWKKSGATNTTSKADVVIGGGQGEEKHGVSLKKGDAQLMSAEPNEFHATYSHAVEQHQSQNKDFTDEHKKSVMDRVSKIQSNLNAMKTTTDKSEQRRLRDEAQGHINSIHSEHPSLLHHVAFEASTGHGKFGQGGEGTARHLVTTIAGSAPHVHDTETGHQPIEVGTPRVALPKGKNRPGNVKLDYKTKNLK